MRIKKTGICDINIVTLYIIILYVYYEYNEHQYKIITHTNINNTNYKLLNRQWHQAHLFCTHLVICLLSSTLEKLALVVLSFLIYYLSITLLSSVDVYDFVLVNKFKYVWGIHEYTNCAYGCHKEEYPQLCSVHDHGYKLPIFSDLK